MAIKFPRELVIGLCADAKGGGIFLTRQIAVVWNAKGDDCLAIHFTGQHVDTPHFILGSSLIRRRKDLMVRELTFENSTILSGIAISAKLIAPLYGNTFGKNF